ncbi:hypothetical protein QBC34DRAFT_414560 [Podospora aff. communis PSN243]|uniref:Uncharacterized protein n=1 Tax=Podospora aff. communis PSN243 TaxID=3040156 RepID=A0AAV9GBM1_9PEZI|nr:hypothetical protein QBC34DRAFT_414560 [Podospora aff. communis PSN243]
MIQLQTSNRRRLILLAVSFQHAFAQQDSQFDICKVRLDGILNGTLTYNGIDNVTVQNYIYRGKIGGMKDSIPQEARKQFIAITTAGCKAICDDPIDWYWASDPATTLGIISNWVLPIIALLSGLPYDSGQGRRKLQNAKRTMLALCNWLGSPQTALAATFFNIHQMRKALAAAKSSDNTNKQAEKDAYYVLCCIGQFDLPQDKTCFVEALTYGLFKPLRTPLLLEAEHSRTARRLTAELLGAMAHQMRRSRRLGVWSTCASIFLFFVAYAVSVVLAFGDLGERTTTHSLAFGILITWFPLLLFFSILDRNPNSAERTRRFISRWLWNVRAVKHWEESHAPYSETPIPEPNWWSPAKEFLSNSTSVPDGPHHIHTYPDNCVPTHFIGQGREIGYHPLTYTVTKSITSLSSHSPDPLSYITSQTISNLKNKPPGSWIFSSLTGLILVWWEISMALMISYNIPTVGIGCRSGSYIIYGLLSTVPWVAHVWEYAGPRGKGGRVVGKSLGVLGTGCAWLGVVWLVGVTFAAFSGVLRNCTCRGGLNGYIDFQNAEFYRNPEHFDVKAWWVAAAVTAAVPVVLSFVVALPVWVSLRELWKDEEFSVISGAAEDEERWLIMGDVGGVKADMDWVAH